MASKILSVSKAVIVNSNKDVLLVKRSDTDDRRPGQWDIPGGRVDPGESERAAAARETLEEVGFDIPEDDLVLYYSMTEKPEEDSSVTWLIYGGVADSEDVILSHEHSEFAWVSLDAAIDMLTYERQRRALSYIAENRLLDLL